MSDLQLRSSPKQVNGLKGKDLDNDYEDTDNNRGCNEMRRHAAISTELLRRVQKHAISGKSCLYVKYAADTRYDTTAISTHDQ